jgi:hypothetical protein
MLVYIKAIWSILRHFGIFGVNLVNIMVIWYIFPVLVCCTKKNLAALLVSAFCLAINSGHEAENFIAELKRRHNAPKICCSSH